MNRRVAGGIGLAVSLGGAVATLGDFRTGRSRFWLSGGVNVFTFDRFDSPILFWASTLANILLLALLTFGSTAAMLLPGV